MGIKTKQADQESRYLIGFFGILVVICCACYQFFPLFLPKCYESSVERREPISNENFEGNWSIADLFLSVTDSAIFMTANENHIVLYGSNGRCGNPKLINLNADDGAIFREGVKAMPSNRGIYHTAYNSDYFFLGYNGSGKAIEGTTTDAGGIAAYEINTSELRWTRRISGTREIRSLVSGDNLISIDGGGFSHWFYLINSKTGEIVTKQDKLELGLPSPPANFAYWYHHVAMLH